VAAYLSYTTTAACIWSSPDGARHVTISSERPGEELIVRRTAPHSGSKLADDFPAYLNEKGGLAMNSEMAASAVSLITAACAAVGIRKGFPFTAKVADPVPAPSNLRKSLRSTVPTPP
jgi:hypothetical protein